MSSTSSASTPARRDIQGLRALAVVAVIATHVFGWPSGGFVGVDVFFVVSGYLITGILLRELAASGTISLRDFFARRVRRILPAALLVLVAVAAAGFIVFHRGRADATLWDAVAAAALVVNWRFAFEGTDYFAETAVSPLQHFWSLSVEEQFYLVWPVLLLALILLLPVSARRGHGGRGVVALAAVVILGASAAWATVQTADAPTVAYFSSATRAGELAVGALLAAASPLLTRLPAAVRMLLQWTGLAGIVWSCLVIDAASPFPAPWAALPVAATALVVAGGVGGDPRQRHLFPLTNPVSVWLGDLSYALYLWHFPVLVFVGVLLPAGDGATAIVLAATVVLAVSTYYGVEQPLHRSPWLRRRTDADAAVDSPAAPTPVAPPAAARPVAIDRRPAGWVPGQRYYPGQQRRSAPPESHPAAMPVVPGTILPPGREKDARSDESRPQAAGVRPHPEGEPRPSEAPEGTPSPWAAWRARFRGQIGAAASGLGIGAIVVVLLLQSWYGFPVLGPATPAATDASAAVADDPSGAIQAELAEAVMATAWPGLRPSLDEVIAASSSANPAHDCFTPDAPFDPARCTWGSADAPRRLWLVGDSTAMSYAPAFKKLAEDSGGAWQATTVGLYGCRFTDVLVANPDPAVMAACPSRKAEVRAAIAAGPADLVVVSNAYTLGRTADGRDLSASDLLAATQAETAAYGVPGRIVYLAPPPSGGDLARCYSPVTTPANCLTAVDQTWRDMQAAAEAIAAASGNAAIDALPFSCWQDACPAFAGGMPVRYDQTHLTTAYAEHVAPTLRHELDVRGLW